jgi:hypothetical protein
VSLFFLFSKQATPNAGAASAEEPNTLSCDKAPATKICTAESDAVRECCAGGGGGSSGGGGMCDAAVKCGVACEFGTTCVDCDGDGIGETCQ